MKALVGAAALVSALSGITHADTHPDDIEPPPEPPTHTRLFGWRMGSGMIPVRGIEVKLFSLALAVEHRVYGNWRISGEYEYAWLGVDDPEQENNVADGTGHRATLAIRRTLLESPRLIDRTLRLYADAELGGSMLLGSEPMTGTIAQPQVFAGVRLGYTFIKIFHHTRASPVWEPEVILRAIATRRDEPLGYYVGIGIHWGD